MLHYEPCVAVVGFVSAMRGPILFETRQKSIKSIDFLAILNRLRAMSGKRWITILLDNASIHKTIAVRNYCATHQITMAFNVPYSPQYNGIEEVWSVGKNKFRKLMLERLMG